MDTRLLTHGLIATSIVSLMNRTFNLLGDYKRLLEITSNVSTCMTTA